MDNLKNMLLKRLANIEELGKCRVLFTGTASLQKNYAGNDKAA